MSQEVCYKTLDFLGYPNYRVGTDGSCWRFLKKTSRWKQLGGSKLVCRGGHRSIQFGRKGGRFYLHHLILLAFVGPCPEGMECRHLDGNPENNNLDNLVWGTRVDNMKDRVLHGGGNHGSRNGMSKLTEDAVRDIRRRRLEGQDVSVIASVHLISKKTVRNVCSRKTGNHVP